ncbi:MAG: type I 3-dehydroquinate dehydratase [Acidobacteria bacterium]|nr:type I 3-dehydroquinate dehydratase [Acidobacteriota bacterium]
MAASLLCETVTGATMAELVAARDAAMGDMVELRLDGVLDLDVDRALAGRRRPVIVTCRPAWEGGRFEGSEEERHAILARALELGAEHVDVEWQTLRQIPEGSAFHSLIRQHRGRILVSSHDFSGVPADLPDRVRAMRGTGAPVIKVAVTASRLTDMLPLLEVARGGNAVVIGMGEAGVASRVLASRFGSPWTYAGNGVAPGQLSARCMLEQFRFRHTGPRTAVYGVVGATATHSISPAMHNAAFAASGVDAVYVPLRAADFGDFLAFADALGIVGASVTIPYKLDALKAAVAADELARAVGAANTLRRVARTDTALPGPNWEATNTDVDGFLEPLDEVLSLHSGLRAAVLGAGGAARAVVAALASRGATVTVHARREHQARVMASDLSRNGQTVRAAAWPPAAGSWDLLVNCTPLGGAAARDESPLPGGRFDGRLVYDLTYGIGRSRLLREAGEAGCATLDGLPMLVAQAERQFAWWTGQRAPSGVMREAAQRALAETAETGAAGAEAPALQNMGDHGAR